MGTNVSNAYASEEWAGESETQGSLCYLRPCFKNKLIKIATAFSQFYLTDPVWNTSYQPLQEGRKHS